ncbi:LytR C-terminal domain-containing protein [Isoptericola sp. b441]|uniref:LytR C-terminal domain-containing protein n=1 Tax=Actinotalea lenta TaxID=3064654 RepID=A0ABT9D737_9CELL|nr:MULTISPECIES: LytR C-terminal domain-containing protein [unclassified Isoptericola]MDO8106651.1 LytR C-terminal domain-containing protein [Isoptericola sp. b441]MDO8121641.1 LytR C-terminal domain-containing protein [Isoptericola sp. b490]
MRSPDYPYPPDEFDAAAGAGGPRGVHRTPRSAWSRWWPFLVVVILFPALAYGAVTLLSGGLPFGSSAATASSSTSPTTSAAPSQTGTPSQTPTATQTPTPTPTPDLTSPVSVQNATRKAGLAGGASDLLKAAGFTDVSIGNWTGATQQSSAVFYPAPEDQATATKVAESLGISRVEQDAALAGTSILVVLEGDYTP